MGKFANLKDANEFFSVINSCKGDVYLVSDNGDIRINLKSAISQYVGLMNILNDENIKDLYLETGNEKDMRILENYMNNLQ